jgi:hypothetical protein
MYDILNKMKLLEGKGNKPDFLDLDKDGNKKESMKDAAQEVDESVEEGSTGDYSAKKARAGKDIGKPGKTFAKIAKGAAERYGSKERGEKVAGAVLAKLRKEDVTEADVEEGNDFTGARLAAIRAGKPTFKVDGKTYRVTGDTSDEKVMEREYGQRDDFDRYGRPGDTIRTTKGTLTKTATGVKHERRPEDEEDSDDDRDDSAPRKRGRPAGSKRALGAKGPTGRSKLLNKKSIREGDLEEDYDKDEYDEEGEMAKSQLRTIEDAAEELQSILDSDENLPEWAQKKITLAKEYIDSARDYLAANRPEDEMVAEKAVSKAQRAAAGIAYAAKKGDIPKSELRGASKEMAKMATGELKKFAKTKEKGLPEKKAEESMEETTTSGSVATAPTEAPKGKKGMVFGKGVYEGQLAESYEAKLQSMLTEGMNINMSMDAQGGKSLTVSATDEDAVKLATILKLAGMEQATDYHEVCPACGAEPCGCEEQIDEELANSPDEQYSDTDTMINTLAGGLNGPKRQINPNNMGDNPMAMAKLGKGPASLNLGESEAVERRLMDLYRRIDQ